MSTASKPRIVVLGAGFGGLELTTLLSEELGDSIDVTLIDKSDSFVFGFSKLDVMFGHRESEAVRLPYSRYTKPGVRLLKRTITSIDPDRRRVTTNDGIFDADFLTSRWVRNTTSMPPQGWQEQPSSIR
jgi:sulfide:quinone oxidoreductase